MLNENISEVLNSINVVGGATNTRVDDSLQDLVSYIERALISASSWGLTNDELSYIVKGFKSLLEEIEVNIDEAKELAFNEGHSEGFDDGHIDGFADGKELGYDDGYSDGFDDGKLEGYEKGFEEGSANE